MNGQTVLTNFRFIAPVCYCVLVALEYMMQILIIKLLLAKSMKPAFRREERYLRFLRLNTLRKQSRTQSSRLYDEYNLEGFV